jgi:sugar/nucleoside kinase (ribokinase family)
LRILQALKEINPATKVSFDPGHAWCKDHSQEIDALVQISDFLILNYREFRELGRYVDGDTDAEVAGRLVQHFNKGARVAIVKRPNGILSFHDENGSLRSDYYPQSVLTSREIRDATGAGDIFAAGLLTTLTCERLQVELGCMLGMNLARHKLRYVGSRDVNFADALCSFLKRLERR